MTAELAPLAGHGWENLSLPQALVLVALIALLAVGLNRILR